MPGVETALMTAGKTIAERAMREVLATRAARAERGAQLSDLIQATFRDRISRRKFENQVEGIALAVEGRLRPLIEHEYGGLDEPSRAAVLLEVAGTLGRADLSDTALFSVDGDPVKLAERIAARLPAPRLGETEDRLYQVMLAECLECVVRMVQQLPQYVPRASTETLHRLTGLAEQMERLLSRMPVRTFQAPEGRQDDAAFERHYLGHISQVLDQVELFGVRVENYRPRTSLSVAYISLSVSTAEHRAADRFERMPLASLTQRHDEPETGSLRVEAALGRSRLMLLRGEAGSGKSTLLRWLAVNAARGGFTDELAAWNGRVPLLVKLRSHAEGGLPEPRHLLDDMAREVTGRMPRGWVERMLDDGRGLLLVDGVDELAARQRPAVRQWLSGLLAAYPALNVVVTSRPTAADTRWLADEGFAAALLEPMTPDDLRALIRQWHLAMRDCPSLPCAPEELDGYEGGLLSRLEGNPHLRLLAATPLLAAMLCALNLDRRTHLPRSRMRLYDAVLAMLLERRDAERGIDDQVSLDPEQKIWILRDLAWRLVATGRSELSKATALRRVEQKLPTMTRMPHSAAQVLDHLLTRSGVLREPVTGRIDFAHKTVQEYLAAAQLVQDEDMEIVVDKAHLDQWREVVVMTAGHATGRLRAELLAGLLHRADHHRRHARRLRLLIAACLETIEEIPSKLRDRIEACLAQVIPPRSDTEAGLLAAAGEEVLHRLPDDLSSLSADRAGMVVRTAWLVNGRAALTKLAAYSADPRPQVQDRLISGWDYFDPEEYAQRVLATAPLPDETRITNPRLLHGLRHLRNLSRLDIDCPLTDLSFLADVPQLRSLDMSDLDTDRIDQIGRLQNLRSLRVRIADSHRIDCAPLADLRQLTGLWLSNVRDGDGLAFLDRLPRLTGLGIELPSDEDLGPLARQTDLKTLSLTGDRDGDPLDVSAFGGMIRLNALSLWHLDVVGGIAAIADTWPSVKMLYLAGLTELEDLAAVGRLSLTRLGLDACSGLDDISPLCGQSALTTLQLVDLPITDLTPLAELDHLHTLELVGSRLNDLAPLAALPSLSLIYLHGVAEDIDLAPLAGKPGLVVHLSVDQKVRNAHLLRATAKIHRS